MILVLFLIAIYLVGLFGTARWLLKIRGVENESEEAGAVFCSFGWPIYLLALLFSRFLHWALDKPSEGT